MIRDIEMKQTSGSDLERNEYIKDTEAHRHRNEEVAGDNPVCMIPDESRPALILAATRARGSFDVFSKPYMVRAESGAEPKFICHPLFSPGQILGCHSGN
jgi:hypothetical protein